MRRNTVAETIDPCLATRLMQKVYNMQARGQARLCKHEDSEQGGGVNRDEWCLYQCRNKTTIRKTT